MASLYTPSEGEEPCGQDDCHRCSGGAARREADSLGARLTALKTTLNRIADGKHESAGDYAGCASSCPPCQALSALLADAEHAK